METQYMQIFLQNFVICSLQSCLWGLVCGCTWKQGLIATAAWSDLENAHVASHLTLSQVLLMFSAVTMAARLVTWPSLHQSNIVFSSSGIKSSSFSTALLITGPPNTVPPLLPAGCVITRDCDTFLSNLSSWKRWWYCKGWHLRVTCSLIPRQCGMEERNDSLLPPGLGTKLVWPVEVSLQNGIKQSLYFLQKDRLRSTQFSQIRLSSFAKEQSSQWRCTTFTH